MPRIELTAAPARSGSGYPPPFDAPCATRTRRRLGAAGGLVDFGKMLCNLCLCTLNKIWMVATFP